MSAQAWQREKPSLNESRVRPPSQFTSEATLGEIAGQCSYDMDEVFRGLIALSQKLNLISPSPEVY